MDQNNLSQEIYEKLEDVPLFDIHTHLVGGKIGAAGLHDIILYHMSVSELYSAGCPSGARLTQYPGFPDKDETRLRIKEAMPYFKYVTNTGISWGIRIILKDLYGITEPVNESNWKDIDDTIRQTSSNRLWQREILSRAGIERLCTEIARRECGLDDDILDYSLEWGFFTRCQWGEFDTALYELEKCWGKTPESPSPIGKNSRPLPDKTIKNIDDVRDAVEYYVSAIPDIIIKSTATHISTDLDLSFVTDAEMKNAIEHRDSAGEKERDIYASYINEAFLTELEKKKNGVIFQFSYGAEPLPYETGSRLSQKSIAQLAEMISRHPGLRFQCFLASRHANQQLCTLCRELPNLSLAGYWWHNFFPTIIKSVIDERLDMLPMNRQVGFFSDAYCVEWAYAKAKLVRIQFAEALAQRVQLGQYSKETAIETAENILYKYPCEMFGYKK